MNRELTEDLRIRVDEATRQALEERAVEEERSMAQIVRRYIRQGLDRDRAAEPVGGKP
jgi:hypothetical protein